ncbi:Nif3-like dinuclear metal center hexameric protein [Marivirga sp. S37H4]|uniref:GTP cyclohydrolase 1 type 2 homolog n=1 Tax=Marivirga aurantiaca TaxID=2802615 RepID=A0A935C5H2_9BACT|nr:Nif3-like dinuclear metal center hexameric protein [Marivirga aurantiaca]MBK6263814.1 Nif3-like dinuclear metal center hexameric protein [Marivirga aurantiaca]
MIQIKVIIQHLNAIAPGAYQESYDNAGLIIGDSEATVSNILITLDVTEAVVQEAINKGCELIVAHHPIIFKGLKKLTGSNYVERTVIKAIKNDIAIYASHTNLDNVKHGVNAKICEKLGLNSPQILRPKSGQLAKLSVFVPIENSESVKKALHEAGAGQIGEYKDCAFESSGTGSFLPSEKANPNIGTKGELEKVNENKIEVIFPMYLKNKVLHAMNEAHPHEEVAYYLHQLENEYAEVGSGMIAELASPMSEIEFLDHLKGKMNLKIIKHTPLLNKKIKTVAVCGGSGSFLIKEAIAKKADVYISADIKYHEYFDADSKVLIADIGHYESEIFTNELFYEILRENFANIALHLGETVTNPIKYY